MQTTRTPTPEFIVVPRALLAQLLDAAESCSTCANENRKTVLQARELLAQEPALPIPDAGRWNDWVTIAYRCLREKNSTIPDDVLDAMHALLKQAPAGYRAAWANGLKEGAAYLRGRIERIRDGRKRAPQHDEHLMDRLEDCALNLDAQAQAVAAGPQPGMLASG